MIRFILTASFVVLFLILSIPLLLVEWVLGKLGYTDAKDKSSLAIVNWAFRGCLFFSGVHSHVIGEENVPKDQPVLYIANHNSYFDILLTYVRVPRPTGYIAKGEMLKIPLLSHWMKNLHCKFLDRSNMKKGLEMILDAIKDIKNGISICIFPEGTRNKSQNELEMLPFHEGSFKIAEKSGCLIIPVALTGTADIFENHLPKIRSKKVTIEYGTPIDPKTLSKEERKFLGVYCQNEIKKMLQRHHDASIS